MSSYTPTWSSYLSLYTPTEARLSFYIPGEELYPIENMEHAEVKELRVGYCPLSVTVGVWGLRFRTLDLGV